MPAHPVDPARSARARAASANSPWRKGPHAASSKAKASFIQYRRRGKAGTK